MNNIKPHLQASPQSNILTYFPYCSLYTITFMSFVKEPVSAHFTPDNSNSNFFPVALKELEGNPDSRTSSLMKTDKFSAVREVVRHFARLRSATKEPWGQEDVRTFLEGLRYI